MLSLMVPVILSLAATAKAYREQPYNHESAASLAQIRFAIENKYDDTGPGAKEPQFAYNTYKNLDDALIAYLDDPDTKLSQYDRNRAIQKLTQYPGFSQNNDQKVQRYQPKTVEEYTGYKQPQIILTKLNLPKKFSVPYDFRSSLKDYSREKELIPYKLQRYNPVRGNPLSVGHYSRDRNENNPHPKYAFSYGVDEPGTGDHKSAHEEREGGAVRGFYSFLDADGSQRTVHYTADDHLGFQATVEKD